jgi:hypothetical protein
MLKSVVNENMDSFDTGSNSHREEERFSEQRNQILLDDGHRRLEQRMSQFDMTAFQTSVTTPK